MIKKIKIGLATKFALTFVLLLFFTMAFVYYAVHQTVVEEFTEDYRRDVQSSLVAIQKELLNRQQTIRQRLRELAASLSDDNDFRLHLSVLRDINHAYIVDYASNYMKTMGLDALEVTTRNGLVLSSGHYRNAFGRNVRSTIQNLRSNNKTGSVVWFERVSNNFPALASLDSLFLGNQKLYVVGGIEINNSILNAINQDSTNSLVARFDTSMVSSIPIWENFSSLLQLNLESSEDSLPEWIQENFTLGHFQIPMIRSDSVKTSEFILFHPKSGLTALLDNIRRNILVIFGVGMLIAIILSVWRTRAVVKPLSQLASEASKLSLDNLELDFERKSKHSDEVGLLSQALHRMVSRLRQSRAELAAAEQKAARAEIARQVSHDLKNGFLPIRHVLQHWEDVARTEPENLIKIFSERKSTVQESLKYLQDLSKLYTELQPKQNPVSININQLVQQLIKNYQDFSGERIRFEFQSDSTDPVVRADKVQLRRAFENILHNAIEAIPGEGIITLVTKTVDSKVLITCQDTGCGLAEHIKDKLLISNISTKSDGTGIGLTNVKRIIKDAKGSISIKSNDDAGKGTTVEISLPKSDASLSENGESKA